MIRQATLKDVPALVRMARSFLTFAPHGHLLDTNDSSLALRAEQLLGMQTVAVFVGEHRGQVHAMLIAVLTPAWCDPFTMMAAELAWWVDEEARMSPISIRLVRAYEQWARDSGAKLIAMSSLATNNGPDVGRMLSRLGYAKTEMTYIKEA